MAHTVSVGDIVFCWVQIPGRDFDGTDLWKVLEEPGERTTKLEHMKTGNRYKAPTELISHLSENPLTRDDALLRQHVAETRRNPRPRTPPPPPGPPPPLQRDTGLAPPPGETMPSGIHQAPTTVPSQPEVAVVTQTPERPLLVAAERSFQLTIPQDLGEPLVIRVGAESWTHLPGLGNGRLRLVPLPEDANPLWLLSGARGQPGTWTMVFHSARFDHHGEYVMTASDTIKMCPAGYYWPHCRYCDRFIGGEVPFSVHLLARNHRNMLRSLRDCGILSTMQRMADSRAPWPLY